MYKQRCGVIVNEPSTCAAKVVHRAGMHEIFHALTYGKLLWLTPEGCVPDAPLDKGNPMASNIQPYSQPANHQAHVDSAGAHP